jgi:hypothetical protein
VRKKERRMEKDRRKKRERCGEFCRILERKSTFPCSSPELQGTLLSELIPKYVPMKN